MASKTGNLLDLGGPHSLITPSSSARKSSSSSSPSPGPAGRFCMKHGGCTESNSESNSSSRALVLGSSEPGYLPLDTCSRKNRASSWRDCLMRQSRRTLSKESWDWNEQRLRNDLTASMASSQRSSCFITTAMSFRALPTLSPAFMAFQNHITASSSTTTVHQRHRIYCFLFCSLAAALYWLELSLKKARSFCLIDRFSLRKRLTKSRNKWRRWLSCRESETPAQTVISLRNFSPFSDLVAAAHLSSSFILEMVFVLSFFSGLGHCRLPFSEEDWAAWSLLIGRTLVDPKCAPESDLWLGLNPRERKTMPFAFTSLSETEPQKTKLSILENMFCQTLYDQCFSLDLTLLLASLMLMCKLGQPLKNLVYMHNRSAMCNEF
nr:hypothetical protein Itr_chr12CG25490 [Ipomoea trifida]